MIVFEIDHPEPVNTGEPVNIQYSPYTLGKPANATLRRATVNTRKVLSGMSDTPHMTAAGDNQLERVLREKGDAEWVSAITGLKLLLFGIQLTLIGGFIGGLEVFGLVGFLISLVGLVVR